MTEPTTSSAQRTPGFAEVAVDSPAAPGRTFSYSIPPGLQLQPGHLVRVPFGPRTLRGLVMSLADSPQVPDTRSILPRKDSTGDAPLLTETQLALTRWISDYYISPLFDAAALMLPPGERVRPRTRLSISPAAAERVRPLSPFPQKVVDYVTKAGAVDLERLVRALGEGSRASANRLVELGTLARTVEWGRPSVQTIYAEYAGLSDEGRRAATALALDPSPRAPRQAGLLARLADDATPLLLKDARKQYGPGAVKALIENGWVQKHRTAVDRDPLAGRTFHESQLVTLTSQQRAAAAQVSATLEDAGASPRAFLIQGVTGSGKTEIYLDAAARCIGLGKRAIVLVPEIALTHQTVERFASRFPGRVAVLHSGLSAGQRFDQWWKVKRGEYDIVVGSRSAIFAPQPDLGLVIIDEEHEWTYKQQDAAPRYHARDVALMLARLTGAVVLMGSASPDVTTHHRALRGRYGLLTLPDRVAVAAAPPLSAPSRTSVVPATPVIPAKAGTHPSPGGADTPTAQSAGRVGGHQQGVGRPPSNDDPASAALPPEKIPLAGVQIVDMRRELREGNRDVFSRALHSAMRECLDSDGQMVLFLNRRGSSSYVQCRNCGQSPRCRRCEIAMTYHRQAGRLLCHYCGYKRAPPTKCPRCFSYKLRYYGLGTQSIVDSFQEQFPGVPVLRWDRDAAKNAKAYEELLERFRSGRERVLVGTQMIAKGLHFPSVTLVGAVSADVGLNIPDYRAGERAFQLLCQVAGRAGRGTSPGRVIVQTYQPENYAVRAAAAQDYRAFYDEELAFRREQADPPFGRLIRLLYSHTNQAVCERDARKLGASVRRYMEESGTSDTDVLGPTPAYPPRLRGHYRWHIVLRGPNPRAVLDKLTIPQGWTIDVDPVALT